MKAAISELQKVGEKLGKYEVEKRQAVENEDYDKAKLRKVQMDEYRLQVYKELNLPDLLETSGVILNSRIGYILNDKWMNMYDHFLFWFCIFYTPAPKEKEVFCFTLVCLSVTKFLSYFFSATINCRCLKFYHTLCWGTLFVKDFYFCTNQTPTPCWMMTVYF